MDRRKGNRTGGGHVGSVGTMVLWWLSPQSVVVLLLGILCVVAWIAGL